MESSEKIEAPSLDEIKNGPRLILGPFHSDWYENRTEISKMICRPEGYTGTLYSINLDAVRKGDPDELQTAKNVLSLYSPARIEKVLKTGEGIREEEVYVMLNQQKELSASIDEGENKKIL